MPKVSSDSVVALLKANDSAILPDAIRLAAAWMTKEAGPFLRELAVDEKQGRPARLAAVDALAVLHEADDVRVVWNLAATGKPMAIRFHAAAALAPLDLDTAAAAAAKAIAVASEADDPAALVQAFLVRKGGSDKLADALKKESVGPDAAKRVLRAMYLAGRNDASLADVVSKIAGIDAAPKAPTPQEIVQLAGEAMSTGDAKRGELVFRRADLGCIKCHGINKAGGHIGPDLGPIGGSSPMDYIITSILDPNASIKEEYLTKAITTTAGKVVTGIVMQRNKNEVVLKDATGKIIRIPTADIDEEINGKSLMPEGVTRILTRPELVDLVRFVSELGKPGGPYAAPPAGVVHRWKRLRDVPASLVDNVPNLDVIRETMLRSSPEAWDAEIALFGGNLPLTDFVSQNRKGVVYLQVEIQVGQQGPIEFRLVAPGAKSFWIDDREFENQSPTVTLAPGRHKITVRAQAEFASAPFARLELRKPADSKAHFEVVSD